MNNNNHVFEIFNKILFYCTTIVWLLFGITWFISYRYMNIMWIIAIYSFLATTLSALYYTNISRKMNSIIMVSRFFDTNNYKKLYNKYKNINRAIDYSIYDILMIEGIYFYIIYMIRKCNTLFHPYIIVLLINTTITIFSLSYFYKTKKIYKNTIEEKLINE